MSGKPGDPAAAGVLVAVRACYGGLLICAPRQMIRLATPRPPEPRAVAVTRVLGGRHLLQALLTATAGTAGMAPGTVLGAGAAVDALHATSMAGLAALSRRLRHVALADAVLEAGLGTFGMMIARRLRG